MADTNLAEYEYDQNGNLTLDKNKNIRIVYNMNNLLVSVSFNTTGEKIEWLYSATGQKLRKNTYDSSNNLVTKTDYVGGLELINEKLSFIGTSEGRLRPYEGTEVTLYKSEYEIKDHFGNVRMTIASNEGSGVSIMQEDAYYPFGLKLPSMSVVAESENKYTCNGKEPYLIVNDELLMVNSSKFIIYNSQFTICAATDPADEFHSPYVYCANNPVMLVDPDGKETKVFIHLNDLGHVSTCVNGSVYSYGRYGFDNNLRSGGLIGDGILRKYNEKDYVDKYTKSGDNIYAFSIKYTPKQEKAITEHFEQLMRNKPNQGEGKKINNYVLPIINCVTTTSDALPDTFIGNILQGPSGPITPLGMFLDLKIMDLFSKDIKQLPTIPKDE